ncbi:MAG TPA: SRPBCC family protein [Gammaproteobacteria bacterium]|nr:SRPBCC family protein [Gammaproteobacteria bacterium]
MTVIKHEGTAPCPASQFFRLIEHIENYPRFLTWCKDARIINRTPNAIQGSALINKYGLRFDCPFTYTLNSKNEIHVSLPSGGPFYAVSGVWRFEDVNNQTRFSFELHLEHKNSWWMNFIMLPILKNEIKQVIKSFEQQAK